MKKYLTGIFALLFAVVLSAFTTASVPTQDSEIKWFVFMGEHGEEDDPTQYAVISAPSCGFDEDIVCEILTEAQSTNPDLPNLEVAPQQVRTKQRPE